MKRIILIIAIAITVTGLQSQGFYSCNYTMSFGSGKTGDYIQAASFRGFTFDGRGFVSDQVSIGGLFNWATFYEELAGASFTDGTATLTGTQYRYLNAFPMLLTAHYYLGSDEEDTRIYLGGGAGAYKMNQEVVAGVWEVENRYWHFGISPEVGIAYPVSYTTYLNISFRYHYVIGNSNTIDYSWFGLSVGLAWEN